MREENARAYWAANLKLIFTYVFLVLIWMYAFTMNRLDRKFDVHEE